MATQTVPREHNKQWLWVIGLLVSYLLLSIAWQDLPLWDFDDAMYLASAKTVHAWMFASGLTTMPGYALWLRGIGLLFRDPVWCQFASWALMVAIVALLPMFAGVRRAWLYAVALIALPFFRIGPYVSIFAAMLLLAGAVLLLRGKPFALAQASTLACAASFAAAYARPEYAYGVVISAAATFLLTLFERRRHAWVRCVLPSALLCAAMIIVMQRSDSSRSGVAFAQHYNLRAAARGMIPEDGAWDSEYAYRAFGIDVHANGGRHTLGEFARSRPKLFIQHVARNLASPLTAITIAGSLVLCALPWFRKDSAAQRPSSVYTLLIALPTFVSLALIFPDHHYVQIVFPSLLILAVQFVPRLDARGVRWTWAVAAAMLVAFALRGTPLAHGHPRLDKPGLNSIACMRALQRDVAVRNDVVFQGAMIPAVYLIRPASLVTTQTLHDWATMMAALQRERPGWVTLTPVAAASLGTTMTSASDELAAQGYAAHACPKDSGLVVFTTNR